MEKICPICNNTFLAEYNNRVYCYKCSPEQFGTGKESIRARKRAIKHQLILYKGGKCEECGYDVCEGALSFHHTSPNEKDFTISNVKLGKDYTMEDLYKEADKCELLCCNCHAIKHWITEK